MKKITIALAVWLTCIGMSAWSADHEVKMMTQGSDGQTLVFEPSFIKVAVGDTVTFKPMQKAGHTSYSIFEPEGAKPWKAQPDSEITVKLDKEGVYLVECFVHKTLGMVAVIQAGKPVNLEAAKQKAAEESAKMAVGKDRFAKELALVK
ncbi:MAG: pseudoazurin [Ferrovum sp.]|jgi:pseudoazurin|uniref:plastocyanin/azurin family copper-binding protein n=1 Tax=Ferrovum sp. TaxID=2609467 RepID=UPI002639C4AD|nr:plastocyanin/azurin family copper-binding protein [Ferrovum sp.]MBW8066625.1 pseudoazurin [Ferrovum sp.]